MKRYLKQEARMTRERCLRGLSGGLIKGGGEEAVSGQQWDQERLL